jgi:triacylglycerol lipase
MNISMQSRLKRLTVVVLLATALSGCGGGDNGSSAPPTVEETSFNLSTAVTLMQLCLQSYQMLIDFENSQPFTLPPPYTLQEQFYTEEHFAGDGLNGMVPIAFIATSGSSIYLVFRGTKTISEWIADATVTQVDYTYVANGGKTETGFTTVYESIRAGIIQKLTSLASGGTYTTLYITGHSLGAALAVVAAPDLIQQTEFKQPVVYTFAGPRAGDPVFVSLYNGEVDTCWRVVNTNDEVPKVPPPVITIVGPPPDYKPQLFFYEHVNDEYAITFGEPIHSISDLEFDHSSCNYFATLCGQTSNPTQCKAMGQGLNDCNFS